MLMFRDLLDMSAKTCLKKKTKQATIFLLCGSVTACCVQGAVMGDTCVIQLGSQDWFVFLQREMRQEGTGEN